MNDEMVMKGRVERNADPRIENSQNSQNSQITSDI
jgi:hypothetical protein